MVNEKPDNQDKYIIAYIIIHKNRVYLLFYDQDKQIMFWKENFAKFIYIRKKCVLQ